MILYLARPGVGSLVENNLLESFPGSRGLPGDCSLVENNLRESAPAREHSPGTSAEKR